MGLLDQELLLMNSQIGQNIGTSNWTIITQERINKFAKITEDPQFIHIDPDRAEKNGPFGKTIAHGFLILSLASKFAIDIFPEGSSGIVRINYGFNKIRFIHPVFVKSLVRGTFYLNTVKKKGEFGLLQTYELTIEIKDSEKPALVAEWLTLTQFNN